MPAARRRVVIVGAGAAGSMAAIFAARGGADATLLERTADGGRKILISGGGRCNVLPMAVDESRFVTDSSAHTLRRMVRAWPLAEQRAFFEREVGIPLSDEPEALKTFPASHKARDVRDGLLALATRGGATLRMNAHVQGIAPLGDGWQVTVGDDAPLIADAVILASGGLSVPATGSDGFGLSLAASLGHTLHPTYPALTPLLAEVPAFNALAGVSLTVTITARDANRAATATGGFLFTHRGYSGPAVLDISHVVTRSRAGMDAPATVTVQWSPLRDAEWERAFTAKGARAVASVIRDEMPDRLATTLLGVAQVDAARTLGDLRREERLRLIGALVRCPFPWSGDEGYKKAEVTGGGVSLGEVDPRTMESRKQPGLFLCGEVLDAFGPIGGYNFLWSWATGRAAGIGASASR